jgi:hypothetical protein
MGDALDALALAAAASSQKPSLSPPPAPPVVRSPNFIHQKPNDWARLLTVEERQSIREKIKDSYRKNVSIFEDLLEICAAMEEEALYVSAASRLDYFYQGVQYEKRIGEKKRQLHGSKDVDDGNSSKRVKTSGSGGDIDCRDDI